MSLFWAIRSLIFLAIALPTSVYAWKSGGAPERWTAVMVVAPIVATTALARGTYVHVVWPLAVIDLALLGGIMVTALFADRYWPMCFAAAHLLTVAIRGVRAYDPTILPMI